MRKIKFRCWDGIRYTMSGIGFNNSSGELIASSQSTSILEQFTGLLDKNGKEIYEGDILQRPDFEPVRVVFNRGGFTITNKDETYHASHGWLSAFDHLIEVIGNIHENPELLNQKPL